MGRMGDRSDPLPLSGRGIGYTRGGDPGGGGGGTRPPQFFLGGSSPLKIWKSAKKKCIANTD